MSAVTVQQMADRVAALMEERLGVRGKGLAAKLKRGGRLLPQRIREEATLLADAAYKVQNPKFLLLIDDERVALAYDACVRHLGRVSIWERRLGAVLGTVASISFSLLVVAGVTLAILVWRGFL